MDLAEVEEEEGLAEEEEEVVAEEGLAEEAGEEEDLVAKRDHLTKSLVRSPSCFMGDLCFGFNLLFLEMADGVFVVVILPMVFSSG